MDFTGSAGFLISGWGVLYSVSLGWSIYSLLDQYPRLIRFGSIWSRGEKFLKRGKYFGPMLGGWTIILFLIFISLGSVVWGVRNFKYSGWDDNFWFPFVFGLIGLVVFVIPIFINRAVWSFILWVFPEHYKSFVADPNNDRYWEGRFSVETACKLYNNPEKIGGLVFLESFALVCALSWAASGIYPGGEMIVNVYQALWILVPVTALLAAGFFHLLWGVEIDPDNLPPALRQKLMR